jgi:hypothetical protein
MALRLGAAAAAVVLAASLTQAAAASTTPAPVAASPVRTTVAGWAAGYLARQITAHGGHLVSFGATDVVDTAYAVLGLHSAAVGRAAASEAIAFLKTQLGSPLQNADGSDNPGSVGYFVLAAVSAGQNPSAFGGTGPANDLVARLLATVRTSGADAGLFGSTDPTYDGAFREGVALAALKAAGVSSSKPAVVAAIKWLKAQQCASGMWTSYRADTAAACPVVDLSTFAGPDTNSTAMAAQGLAAFGERPKRSTLLTTLHSIQSPDGGFAFLAAAGQPSDPDSTALTIQTILAERGFPGAVTWLQGGHSPYDALASYQLGCADPVAQRGAFFYPGSRTPSNLASVQAVPALAATTFPLAHSTPSTSVPRVACATGSAAASTLAVAPRAGKAGHCPGSTGVTVAVDLTAFGKGVVVRCAPGAPSTGIAALKQAGFTVTGTASFGLAFVCRIQGLPTAAQDPCVTTPPPTAYWAYYHALAGATKWTFSTLGASSYKPPQGSIDAWAFGNKALPSKTPAQVRSS